ncbi:HNH endonuclease [Longimicrobium sp.]|uniref:HNH endonuclease n=1 Tax=Longimicrobium sp. TaxID=2029185 RepID=UPI002C67D7C7|nr:HNH endonuclease [Longimicrobium sp.]HSU15455.1 HNH endonuclease [Longimicrobium sp.]
MRRKHHSGALQRDLEERIRNGSCVYCRAPAAPDRPLTREHVIPRARGGRRKDLRIIVPACARCNHRRGSREIVLFLLDRPRRISAFLEYLGTLPPETVSQIDLRVFAELYAALWLLADSASAAGPAWRERLRHLCAGRRLHRRRYAARRIVTAVGMRLERGRDRSATADGPSCLLPGVVRSPAPPRLDAHMARAMATLLGTLSLAWDVPAERVLEELDRERERAAHAARARSAERREWARAADDADDESGEDVVEMDGVLSLDGWKRQRRRRRRTRVDQRGGRGVTGRRGRAA